MCQALLGLISWLCDLSLRLSLTQFSHCTDNYFLEELGELN